MDTLAHRLNKALALRGMSPRDLIERKVLSKAGVYFLLDGTTKAPTVRASTVDKLCKALRVNAEWLQHGRGPMEGAASSGPEDWADIKGFSQAVGLGNGIEAQEYAETHKLKFRARSLARKGLHAENLAVFYGDGDSMLPRIRKGDAVLFDTSDRAPRDGSIFIVQVGREVYAKRCLVLDDLVFFDSLNPDGDHGWTRPRRMDNKRQPIQILGRVRWIGSWQE